MRKMMNGNRYDMAKLLGITTAVLLLIPIIAQTQPQLATAQANSAEPPRNSKLGTADEVFAEIEKRAETEKGYLGFSGLYFDSGKLYVYFTGSEQVNPTEVANLIADYFDPENFQKGVIVLKSNHAWKEWVAWKQILRQLFNQNELGITILDIDEKKQKLVLGFSVLDGDKRSKVTEFLIRNNLPIEDIELTETGPIILESNGVTVRPLKGGIEIGVVGAGACTNGFVANRISNGQRVEVINGHCEASVDTAGDQTYTQPFGGAQVGTEVANTNKPGPRWSDTLLWRENIGISSTLGAIYNGGASDYQITGKQYTQGVGEFICKFGSTTHETCGSIFSTGVDVTHPNYGVLW